MAKAEAMVAAYVAAGFRKIHLDACMGCAGEPAALADATIAERAARLAARGRGAAREAGGDRRSTSSAPRCRCRAARLEALDAICSRPRPRRRARRVEVHREAFAARGLADAFARVIGLVVQPGVEFGNENVVVYEPEQARRARAASSTTSRSSSSRRIRPTTSRAEALRGAGRGRLRHPQGRPRPDLRAARGALRPRPRSPSSTAAPATASGR